jgi:hypothetical protein
MNLRASSLPTRLHSSCTSAKLGGSISSTARFGMMLLVNDSKDRFPAPNPAKSNVWSGSSPPGEDGLLPGTPSSRTALRQ